MMEPSTSSARRSSTTIPPQRGPAASPVRRRRAQRGRRDGGGAPPGADGDFGDEGAKGAVGDNGINGIAQANSLNNGTIVGALTVDGAYVDIKKATSAPVVVEDGSGYVSALVNWTTQYSIAQPSVDDGPSTGTVEWKIVTSANGPALSDFTSWAGVGPAGPFTSATSGTLNFSAEQGAEYAYIDLNFTPTASEPSNETFAIELLDPGTQTVLGSASSLTVNFVNPAASAGTSPPTGDNDILFQNVSGQAAIWDVSGATLTSSALLGANPGPNWKDVGTGDFNDDMLPDILLQNTNGAIAIWETNGTSVTSSAVVANSGPNWHAIGTGDFNDDGHSDILLQNTSGAVAIWDMNGTSITSSAVVANPGANWKAVGTGDFNHDGHSDILLQNTNGAVAIWEMNGANGTTVADSAVVANPGANWKVVGTGDFNGDGHSDILLQNTNGTVAIWEMNGVSATSSAVLANPGPNWHAIGTNGGSDILLQNTSGQTAIWDTSGTSITGSGAVSANAGPNWRAVGLT